MKQIHTLSLLALAFVAFAPQGALAYDDCRQLLVRTDSAAFTKVRKTTGPTTTTQVTSSQAATQASVLSQEEGEGGHGLNSPTSAAHTLESADGIHEVELADDSSYGAREGFGV